MQGIILSNSRSALQYPKYFYMLSCLILTTTFARTLSLLSLMRTLWHWEAKSSSKGSTEPGPYAKAQGDSRQNILSSWCPGPFQGPITVIRPSSAVPLHFIRWQSLELPPQELFPLGPRWIDLDSHTGSRVSFGPWGDFQFCHNRDIVTVCEQERDLSYTVFYLSEEQGMLWRVLYERQVTMRGYNWSLVTRAGGRR